MDNRKALQKGTRLDFEGISCEVGEEIGRGSNTLVYQGSYRDAMETGQFHRILIKELFPFHPEGKIYRRPDGSICVEPEGNTVFEKHRCSFEAGNRAHLTLLEACPEQIGANLNTFSLNGTLYTLLGVSGGDRLTNVRVTATQSLRTCAIRLMAILDALEIFHDNGLAHLDIAPDNIIILGKGNRERALLIDYNSTMPVGRTGEQEPVYLSAKDGYAAPEVQSGRISEVGFPADMYSVTAVFYWMITGKPLTEFQMIRPLPPDVSSYPCMVGEPETVKAWVQEILWRGLRSYPKLRYQNTSVMRQDLEELVDRIDGVGITHWALWEAGRTQVNRMVSDNPSLSFIRDTASLFPSMFTDGTEIFPADELNGKIRENCMLLAGGGMGKTTSLLRMVFAGQVKYAPDRPAMMYLSLYGWQQGNSSYIIDSILDELRFQPETHTVEDARRVLKEMLDHPIETAKGTVPELWLLLDGLNEVTGDPKALLEEINRLAGLRGVRIIVASRTGEEAIPFRQIQLTELSEEIVTAALSGEGLLLPQNPEMQKALRTPMMLSMYISSGQIDGRQVRAETPDDLLRAYLAALKEKALCDLPEQTVGRWQIDAAVGLVLPAVAAEINRRQRGLQDRELLPVVGKCYRLVNDHLSCRFFPQWIGRMASIRGNARNEEEWYGRIVLNILWKQLGLIIRDDQGRFTVAHQVIEAYLLDQERENRKRIQHYHWTRNALICLCLCMTAATSFFAYREWMVPTPYEEIYADNVMTRALDAYVTAGKQYKGLADLTECAMYSPALFGDQMGIFKNANPYTGMSTESSLRYLSCMLETGEVMPWSNEPMDEDACIELLKLSGKREESYHLFAEVLEFVMTDDYANRYYGKQFPELLAPLLETDADITAELYQIVCSPHLTGKYADQSVTAESYAGLFKTVPRQNYHLTGENQKQAREKLIVLEGDREEKLGKLYECGAFAEYESRSKAH